MKRTLTSFGTAAWVAAVSVFFALNVLTPMLPQVVGPPDRDESKSFNLPSSNKLELLNTDGSVEVVTQPEGSDRQIQIEARIRIYAGGKADPEAIDAYVDTLVAVKRTNGTLRVVTETVERPNYVDVRVDYRVSVPLGTDIEIVGANGNIWVAQGCGEVSVHGGNADIEIIEPSGTVLAQSTNGRIRVVNAVMDTTVETVNGNIYAHMRRGALVASSMNGKIEARVLDPAVRACNLTTENGGIRVLLEPEASFQLEAFTMHGKIRSDFPVEALTGIQARNELHGSLGAGDLKLNLDTLNGSIWIEKGG